MSDKPQKILMLDDDFESMQNLQVFVKKELQIDVELTAEKSILQRLDEERFDLLVVDLMIHPRSFNAENLEVENIHYDEVKWDRTGLEFIRRFRKGEYTQTGHGTSTNVPIIVMSAVSDSAANGEWGKIIQNEHRMEKPFRLSDFMKLVNSLLQE
jgi:PleD family two-component response regulator